MANQPDVTELVLRAKNLTDQAFADVLRDLDKTKDRAKQTSSETSKGFGDMKSALTDFAGALGVSLSLGGLVAFGKSMLDMADQTVKVADRTGLATDEVQRLQFIAEQSGNSLDDLTGAMSKLQIRLADGTAAEGVKALGLNFETLRNQSPYEQMEAVAEAIGKIENPTLRAQRATQVFGKAGAEVLPTLIADFKQLGAEAPVMSDETVKALDAAGDAMSKFGTQVKVWAAEAYNYASSLFDKMVAGSYRLVASAYDTVAGLTALAAKIPGASKLGVDQSLVDGLKGQSQWFRDAATAMGAHTEAAKNNHAAVAPLAPINEAAAKAAKDHAEAIASLTATLSGAGAIKAANDMAEALRRLPPIQSLTKDAQLDIAKTMDEAIAVYIAAGKTIPATWTQISAAAHAAARDIAQDLATANKAIVESMRLSSITWKNIAVDVSFEDSTWATRSTLVGKSLTDMFAGGAAQIDVEKVRAAAAKRVSDAVNGPSFWKQVFGSAQQFGADMGNAIIGAIQGGGNVLNSAFGTLGQKLGTHFSDSIGESISKEGVGTLTKALGGLLQSVLPGVGALLGPLMSKAWDGLKNLFGVGSAGRDLVKDFAGTFAGGFDGLHAQLGKLGAEGEKLWVSLTQGVGRNNADQARAAIDAVTAALGRQATAMQNAAETPKPSVADLTAIVERYGGSLADLGPKAQALDITEKANALIESFKSIESGVGDLGGFYNVTADEVNDLIKRAGDAGIALPAALRPFAQEMANAGLLVDGTGKKLTDLSGLKWDETLTDKVGDLVDVMRDLPAAIRDSIAALGELGNTRVSPVHVPVVYDSDGIASDHRGDEPGQRPQASHAFGAYIREDHVARVHAGEIIGPESFMTNALVGALQRVGPLGGGGGDQIIQVHLDGQRMADVLVRRLPDSVRRFTR